MENVKPSQTNVLCVICHQPIELNNFGQGRVILEQHYVGCPNGHLVHRNCLKFWIVNSKACPVCHDNYDMRIITIFNEYIAQVEEDKRIAEENKKLLEEEAKKAEKQGYPLDPEFEDLMVKAEKLALEENYTGAMNIYWDILDKNKYQSKDPRNLKVLLYLSLIYYRMAKYAMSVRQLMKLVKIDYEYPLAFYYLGLNYEEIGLPDKAKWAYDRALVNVQKLVENNAAYNPYISDIQQRIKNIC